MNTEIRVSGDSYDDAIDEALYQLGVTEDALDVEKLEDAHDDILPGAEPLSGVTLRVRVKEDVLIDQAREHLKTILDLIGVKVHIEVMRRRGGITLNLVSPSDGPLIIGRNGQNLEALQVLVNRMVVHGGRDLIAPFAVDSEGYRERRLARLEQVAERAARQALRQGREIELEPMSPSERRTVHMYLRGMRGVHTISRGEGMNRRIVVTPGMPEGGERGMLRPVPAGARRGGGGGGGGGRRNSSDAPEPGNEAVDRGYDEDDDE